MDQDTKNLLAQAAAEIRQLRRVNEILGAKVEMIELFSCVLRSRPAGQSQAMAEDIAWRIDRHIETANAATYRGRSWTGFSIPATGASEATPKTDDPGAAYRVDRQAAE